MKIKLIHLVIMSASLFIGCGVIHIVEGKSEDLKGNKVIFGVKPSEIISSYLGADILNSSNNYCITFYDIYCGYTYQQIKYCNKLFLETNDVFQWIAVTIYDSIEESKYRQKANLPDWFKYMYPTYNNINGLRPSLWNQYYLNDKPVYAITPMTFIIFNDSIKKITLGAINTEATFIEHKQFLDSLAQRDINKN